MFSKFILIVFLLIPLILGVLIFLDVKKIKKRYGTVKKYYLGIKRPSYKKKTNTEKTFDAIEKTIVFLGAMVILFLLTLFASWMIILLKEGGIIKKEYVEYIFVLHQSITFDKVGVIGLIIAIATVLVAFKKEYYLVFSIEDVLEKFQFKEKILTIIYAMVGSDFFTLIKGMVSYWNDLTKQEAISVLSYISSYMEKNYTIIEKLQNLKYAIMFSTSPYEQNKELMKMKDMYLKLQHTLLFQEVLHYSVVMVSIFLVIYSLWTGIRLSIKILNILFSKEQSELELLNNLHYKIKNRNFFIKNNFEISMNAIMMNGEYLYDQYKEAYQDIRNKEMYDVRLRTIFDNDYAINKIAEKRLVKSLVIMLIAGLFISICGEISNIIDGNISRETVVCYGLYIIIGMVYILLFRIINVDMKSGFYRIVLSDNVYLYNNKKRSSKFVKWFRKWKNKNQKEKVQVVFLDSNKSESKYFKAILNLVVYLKIISCNKEKEDVSEYIRYIHGLTVEDEEEILNEKENIEVQADYVRYIINIYYDFFRYLKYDEERKNILKEIIRRGSWFNYIDKLWKKNDFEVDKIIKAICLHTLPLLKTEIQPKKPDEKITDEERVIEKYWNEFKQNLSTNKK